MAVPLVLLGLVVSHLVALHEVGSNNPDGVEIKQHKGKDGHPLDGIPFHPYYTIKDICGVILFVAIFSAIIFFAPGLHGLFLEPANFEPANALKTPPDIHPLWYFGPYYAILRCIPNKGLGALALMLSIVILFVLPWIDRNPVKSIRYRGALYRVLVMAFALSFLFLGFIGMQLATPYWAEIGQRISELYFLFFIISWIYSEPRSRKYLLYAFVTIMIVITALDIIAIAGWPPVLNALSGWKPGENMLQVISWFIPGVYSAVFLLLPAFFPGLNQSEKVPERVTMK